jgi:hypothetical protein
VDGSQTGKHYQVWRNNSGTPVTVGSSVAGTGSAITTLATPTVADTYTVVATDDSTSCTANMTGSAVVTVNSIPSAPTAGSDSPVLPGARLHLTAAAVSGATYAWTGPNFSSSAQNPEIANVTRANNAGQYSVTVTVGGCTSPAGTTTVVVNTPPVAPNSDAGVTANHPLVLSVIKLLSTASDADAGDTLSVSAAGPTSAHGPANNVVLNSGAGTITYTPATDYIGSDSFSYTVSDGNGGTAIPMVIVNVTSDSGGSPNVVSSSYDSGSQTFHVTFAGVPGYWYTIQWSPNVNSGPWTSFPDKVQASQTDGLFEVVDQVSQTPARYYRTVYP